MKTCDLQFCKLLESTCVDSLPIAAGGSHAKRHLSFKAGVFVDIEPLKAVCRAPWDKNENSKRRVWNELLKLPRFLSPKPTKRDVVSSGGTRLETASKTGGNWNDGTTEPKPSSGSDFRGLTLLNTIFQKLTFPQVKKGFRSIRTEPFLTEEIDERSPVKSQSW